MNTLELNWNSSEVNLNFLNSFSASFGYDTLYMIAAADTGGDIAQNTLTLGEISGATGKLVVQPNGEINTEAFSVQIVDGKLVKN